MDAIKSIKSDHHTKSGIYFGVWFIKESETGVNYI